MAKINRMIEEHVNDLQEMANNFKTAVLTGVQTAGALSGNVIS